MNRLKVIYMDGTVEILKALNYWDALQEARIRAENHGGIRGAVYIPG